MTAKGNYPEVIEELGELGSNKHKLKIRIIRFQHPEIGKSAPMLDIRRYWVDKPNQDGTTFTGFGPGISLKIADLHRLRADLPNFIAKLEKL